MRKLEKNRLVRFVAKVMEESGFKVYKNFKTSRHIIDIYGVLPTVLGDMGVVVACKNYDEHWEVGLDVLKEMEMVGKTLKASKDRCCHHILLHKQCSKLRWKKKY